MTCMALPELFTEADQRRLSKAFAETQANADAVAFVGQSTRDHFERRFGFPAHATVIASPIGDVTGVPVAESPASPFLLAVQHGGFYPHKNLAGLLRLFAGMADLHPGLSLKVAGHGNASFHAERDKLPARLQGRIHHLG